MGFDYSNLPKCDGCPLPLLWSVMSGGSYEEEKTRCALYWRPKTGTKCGSPYPNGTDCPRDNGDKLTYKYGGKKWSI